MIAALSYTHEDINETPSLIHSDYAKEFVKAATVEASQQFVARTQTRVSYIPEENGISERVIGRL